MRELGRLGFDFSVLDAKRMHVITQRSELKKVLSGNRVSRKNELSTICQEAFRNLTKRQCVIFEAMLLQHVPGT